MGMQLIDWKWINCVLFWLILDQIDANLKNFNEHSHYPPTTQPDDDMNDRRVHLKQCGRCLWLYVYRKSWKFSQYYGAFVYQLYTWMVFKVGGCCVQNMFACPAIVFSKNQKLFRWEVLPRFVELKTSLIKSHSIHSLPVCCVHILYTSETKLWNWFMIFNVLFVRIFITNCAVLIAFICAVYWFPDSHTHTHSHMHQFSFVSMLRFLVWCSIENQNVLYMFIYSFCLGGCLTRIHISQVF